MKQNRTQKQKMSIKKFLAAAQLTDDKRGHDLFSFDDFHDQVVECEYDICCLIKERRFISASLY